MCSHSSLPTITAHRGGALLWTENSMEAHTKILSINVECIECDIHESADGKLVVFHDNTLERLTENGSGDISEHSFAQLQSTKLKYTQSDTIFSLEQLFNLHKDTNYTLQVELKTRCDGRAYPNIVKSLVQLIQDFGYENRIVPISFSLVYLTQLQDLGFFPTTTQFLFPEYTHRVLGMNALCDFMCKHGINAVGTHVGCLSHDEVAYLNQRRIHVSVWGANDEKSIAQALSLPLVNITSDRPDLALALREAKELATST